MIIIFNPDRLTRQHFFQDLINYLYQVEGATLKQIKEQFPTVEQIERLLEHYRQAGYLLYQDKHYLIGFALLESLSHLTLDKQIFVNTNSQIFPQLLTLPFETKLTNATNRLILLEHTTISRDNLTLANYFFKLQQDLPLSDLQKSLYALLGDVNPEYALKYMTTFLLKFSRKDQVIQKRTDVFVKALELLGYIHQNEERKYELLMDFNRDTLVFRSRL